MKTIYFVLVFFVLSTLLYSTIINVPADQPTIQAGINVATYTDTVLVADGTYYENIDFIGKAITVASNFIIDADPLHIENTIINGSQPVDPDSASVARFTSGEGINSILTGFTMTEGSGVILYYPTSWSYIGGGIYCESSNPFLSYLRITHNNIELPNSLGGGICCVNSSPIMENMTISDNIIENGVGGGIYCCFESSPILNNLIINGNSAAYGGGICCNSADIIVSNTIITSNTANSGGGIYSTQSDLNLAGVTISNNFSTNHGAGLYCGDDSNIVFDINDRCNIYQNTLTNSRGYGADIYTSDCNTIDVILDTFTVLSPTDYYASPLGNLTFDILNGLLNLVNADLYVSPDGDNTNSGFSPDDPLKTIRFALSRIQSDSLNINTIHLLPGIYSPSTNGEIFPIEWNSYCSLEGSGEQETFIDAEDTSYILNANSITGATFSDMTFRNGSTYDVGCILIKNSNLFFENVTITDNQCSTIGGGIQCRNSNLGLTNISITNNSASPYGGGIYFVSSEINMNNVIISGNSTTDYNSKGGGIHFDYSTGVLNNVIISNNTSKRGGGISCSYSSPSLDNVTITGNSAADYGGGIYCNESNPTLMNITMTANIADYGSGIYCKNNSNPLLINSILWNDIPQEVYFHQNAGSNSITISYSDIQGGEAGIVTNNNGTVNWLEGNIDEDPLFVGTGGYPFSLLEDSPCIDAGNPDPIYYDPEDPTNPGYALYPAMGTVINDMGAYGGPNVIGWPVVGLDNNLIVQTPEVLLHQNYPNPFNPTTNINYSLKENSKVSLNIYNIKGQKVKQLVSDQLSTGQHSVIWNGKDDSGKPVSSGIYFYKLKTGTYEKTKKMILLR